MAEGKESSSSAVVEWFKRKLTFGRDQIAEVDRTGYEFSETLTTKSLTGNGVVGARNRQLIYDKYQQMMADPVVSGSLRQHVTAALGGHETSGDLVFIEATPAAKKDAEATKLVEELAADLGPLFNGVAFQLAYNAAGFGDAYARMFPKKGVGVVALTMDEMLLPPLVIPYEQGARTVVCAVAIGPKMREKLSMDQIGRAKMQRMIYTPQPMAVEKAWRTAILEDDPTKLPLMPSLVGGSFLADAEVAYDRYAASVVALVGQRVLDSIDESILPVNVGGMTKEQKQTFLTSVKQMLQKSKAVAEDAVKKSQPILARIRHILPVWGEKQLLSVQGLNQSGGTGGGRASNVSIEDVMFQVKLLCGALGTDPSMLGFADLMSGGLGEGGFFRTSAQAAERSRIIRGALTEFFNHVIEVHLFYKTGRVCDARSRPWTINFFSTISALEAERTKTQMDKVNTAMLMAQCFQMVKDSGLDEDAMADLFETVMGLDATKAKMYARAIAKAKKEQDEKEAQGAFGGGPGLSGDDEPGPRGGAQPVGAQEEA